MGNKQSKKSSGSQSPESLHPHEKRRLTNFLEEKKGQGAQFSSSEVQKLWDDILAPDLMDSFVNFLFKTTRGLRSSIGLNEFISIYVNIVRGNPHEKSKVITHIIGSKKNQDGKEVISYQSLCKYLSDLLESYFLGLQHQSEICYKSWTHSNQPQRAIIEEVMRGVCNDLPRTDDEVRVDLFENWLHQCALVNLLHSYVLGSMYNLSPELESTMIPLAQFTTKRLSSKWSMLLDVSHVVYLNSFLPSEHKEVWRLLFSVDLHGESFSKFVSCIVNQGPILVVVNTNSNALFGGYISTNVALSPKWIGSETSFIFKLSSTVDVYPTTGYNDHFAYLNCHQTTLPNGLGMGGQYGYWGLWIDSQFGSGECSESCTTYKNYRMLDPKKRFHIKSMEVWGVGEPPPTEEEMGVRTTAKGGRSALDQDPTNTHILEMAGRELHSKGFREGQKGSRDG